VVVDNLNITGSSSRPVKADSILVIYPDAVLALPRPLQLLQSVSGRHTEVRETDRDLQLPDFATRGMPYRFEAPNAFASGEALSVD